ncbi:hypothetical protein KY334_05405 [Candidatus Woesearchaeota archaeon]|nr:hypothetical protein [Candidatus Woesearchaeota archaeon]
MSKKVKGKLRLNGLDKELELKVVAAVNLSETDNEFIYMEKLKSGDWRLCYTSTTIEDISKLKNIEIIRED